MPPAFQEGLVALQAPLGNLPATILQTERGHVAKNNSLEQLLYVAEGKRRNPSLYETSSYFPKLRTSLSKMNPDQPACWSASYASSCAVFNRGHFLVEDEAFYTQ